MGKEEEEETKKKKKGTQPSREKKTMKYKTKKDILGHPPVGGTFAQLIRVGVNDLYECPAHLTDAQAAALPLAGLTAYRALITVGGMKPGDSVLVSGWGEEKRNKRIEK